MLKSRRPDARAWVIKYFIAASFSWLLEDCRRIGINEYNVSSSPIQIIIQFVEDRLITTPVVIVV